MSILTHNAVGLTGLLAVTDEKEDEVSAHELQRQADQEHHAARIEWLTTPEPRWACGTPIGKHEAVEMLQKSHEALRYINEHGMSTNSATLTANAEVQP